MTKATFTIFEVSFSSFLLHKVFQTNMTTVLWPTDLIVNRDKLRNTDYPTKFETSEPKH